jgi:arylsulfatase A-like enzyme
MSNQSSQNQYQTTVASRFSLGIFFTAIVIAAIELWKQSHAFRAEISTQDVLLSYFYGLSPILLIALLLAGINELFAKISGWGIQGDENDRLRQWSILAALPIALGALTLFLLLILLSLENRSPIYLSFGLLIWLLPGILMNGYLWHFVRTLLLKVDLKYKKPYSLLLSGFLLLVGTSLFFLFVPSILNYLKPWPNLALLLIPILLTLGFMVATIIPWTQISELVVRRIGILLGLVGFVGLVDLSEQMDLRPDIKNIFLNEALISQKVVKQLQNIFDVDGDGYAGKLGGGDCDDENASAYPGAREIPFNGIDEDCFNGDLIEQGKSVLYENLQQSFEFKPIKKPNIILITVDTLRADHLHYHGYQRKISDHLDQLSSKGLNFQNAYSTGAQTRVSMPAVFIGKYYSEIPRSSNGWASIWPTNVTIAERLKNQQYDTSAIASHNYFNRTYNLTQGFDALDLSIMDDLKKQYPNDEDKQRVAYHITGDKVSDHAIALLDQKASNEKSNPLFLWLHYLDPHHDYRDHSDINLGKRAVDLYDEEIRFTDLQIGRVLDHLEKLQLTDHTYIIFHSDHGECFKHERELEFHGNDLYNDQVHVPLLIVGPNIPSHTIMTPVSLIDIVPTILELAQVKADSREIKGSSLLSFAKNPYEEQKHPIFIEMLKDDLGHKERRAIVDWPWKLHYQLESNQYQLYHLERDPGEQVDKKTEEEKVFQRLRHRLLTWLSEEVELFKPYEQDENTKNKEELK